MTKPRYSPEGDRSHGRSASATKAAANVLAPEFTPERGKPERLLVWMLRLVVCCSLLHLTPLSIGAADTAAVTTGVKAVLDQQARDWNAGDIGKFMQGYLQSDQTRFASGGNVTLGWKSVLERYQKTYGDRGAMGRLTFSDVDVTAVADDAALVFGRWQLKREKDEPSGLFTLFFRKTPAGWRIVHDHTSAAEKK